MTTPTLAISATLNSAPVTRDGELSLLQILVNMAVHAVGGGTGTVTSGTVNLPAGAGSASFTYTPNASS
jgi:hypothetical protein